MSVEPSFFSRSDLRRFRERLAEKNREIEKLQQRFDNFIRDCGTTMYPCPKCGHGMSSRAGCLHCQIDELRQELEECRKAFLKYSGHLYDCERLKHSQYPCTCGYKKARRLVDPEGEEDS
jgi:hypothetical protein